MCRARLRGCSELQLVSSFIYVRKQQGILENITVNKRYYIAIVVQAPGPWQLVLRELWGRGHEIIELLLCFALPFGLALQNTGCCISARRIRPRVEQLPVGPQARVVRLKEM